MFWIPLSLAIYSMKQCSTCGRKGFGDPCEKCSVTYKDSAMKMLVGTVNNPGIDLLRYLPKKPLAKGTEDA